MLSQPGHRLSNSNTERFGTMKTRDKAFDFRIVEHARMRFIPFQIPSQTRLSAAYKVGRDLDNFGMAGAKGIGDFFIDLVPGERFIARDVKGLPYSLGIANQPSQADRKIT